MSTRAHTYKHSAAIQDALWAMVVRSFVGSFIYKKNIEFVHNMYLRSENNKTKKYSLMIIAIINLIYSWCHSKCHTKVSSEKHKFMFIIVHFAECLSDQLNFNAIFISAFCLNSSPFPINRWRPNQYILSSSCSCHKRISYVSWSN